MRITHKLTKCINCGKILEIFYENEYRGHVDCSECGYTNELKDFRLNVWIIREEHY